MQMLNILFMKRVGNAIKGEMRIIRNDKVEGRHEVIVIDEFHSKHTSEVYFEQMAIKSKGMMIM